MRILIDERLNDEKIEAAARLLAFHYRDYKWLEKLRTIPSFNHTTHSGNHVAEALYDCQILIEIRPYKSKWPWSKAIGYARGNTVWVNTRKLDLPLKDRVSNFMHEALHLLGYSHNGNYVTEYNNGTVPYKVGDMFADYVMELKVK